MPLPGALPPLPGVVALVGSESGLSHGGGALGVGSTSPVPGDGAGVPSHGGYKRLKRSPVIFFETQKSRKWTLPINYFIDPDDKFESDEIALIKEGIDTLERLTCLRFQESSD